MRAEIVDSSTDVARRAKACLAKVSYVSVRRVHCEHTHDVLILCGRVASFYEKLLAQEAVRRVPGVLRVINKIEVIDDLLPCDREG
jgi:osmotically-inducible protein OsmY